MNQKSYKDLLAETATYYKSLGKIRCKHIDNNFIVFGNSGFTHLLMKGRKSRPINEQYRKLSLVWKIKSVIEDKDTLIGLRIIKNHKYGQINYISLSSKNNSKIIKVIIRKIGNGNYHFWSVMDT